jgi:hypothetical protein
MKNAKRSQSICQPYGHAPPLFMQTALAFCEPVDQVANRILLIWRSLHSPNLWKGLGSFLVRRAFQA